MISMLWQEWLDLEDVSEERLDLLDRDVLFVNGATKKDMLASPAFSRLKVAKALHATVEALWDSEA